jgi:hypothetical protein
MNWWLAVAMAAMLTGCAARPPADTPEARCQQQVDQDPNVKALMVQAPYSNMNLDFQQALMLARRKAVFDCLAAQGLAPRGGVEPVHPVPTGTSRY